MMTKFRALAIVSIILSGLVSVSCGYDCFPFESRLFPSGSDNPPAPVPPTPPTPIPPTPPTPPTPPIPPTPTVPPFKIKSISAGDFHTLFLAEDGKVYISGYNDEMQLGLVNLFQFMTVNTPSVIPPSYFGGEKIKTIAATQMTSFALTESGKIYSWGGNSYGEAGLSKTTNGARIKKPTPINFGGAKISKLSAGYDHLIALSESGSLFIWGANDEGQLGLGTSGFFEDTPQNIALSAFGVGDKIKDIGAGKMFSAVLSESGKVYTWGYAADGSLGHNSAINENSPKMIDAASFGGEAVTDIFIKYDRMYARVKSGAVYGWGLNDKGQLGTNSGVSRVLAPDIFSKSFLGADTLQNIEVAFGVTFVLSGAGSLFSFGESFDGALAQGPLMTSSSTPVTISGAMEGDVLKVFTGSFHAFSMTDADKVYAWGANEYGRLGLGDASSAGVNNDRFTPELLDFGYMAVPYTADCSFITDTGSPDVTFTNTSPVFHEANIVSYEWDFGDGSTASTKDVKHTFPFEGVDYNVKLTLTDDKGHKSEGYFKVKPGCDVRVDTTCL